MSVLGALLLIASLTAIGWNLVTLAGLTNRWEKLGLAFILGSWLVTVEMMVAYQIGGRFSAQSSLLAIGITLVVEIIALQFLNKISVLIDDLKAAWLALEDISKNLPDRLRSLTKIHPIQLGAMVLTLGFLVYTLISNWIWPVSDWDAIALYDFRAQVIRLAGTWSEGRALGYFYHYPPFTSLWHGLFYQLGFERVKILYTLLFSSFLLVCYQFLRTRTSALRAWLGIFLLTFAPLIWGHIMVAYTNLPYTIYFCLAVFYAINWVESRNKGYLWMSLMLLAGSTWIRQSEPFWVLVIALQLWGSLRVRELKTWVITGVGIALYAVFFNYWPTYTASLDLPPPPVSVNDALGYSVPLNSGTLVHHTFLVTDHVLKSVVQPLKWLLLPTMLVLVWDREFWRNRTSRLITMLLIIMALLIWGGTFYFSFTYKSWHLIGESLTRLTMVTVPLMIVILAQSSLWLWGETLLSKPSSKSTQRTRVRRRR